MPHWPINVIADAGAFRGITALEFSDAFPKALILGFEPTPTSFEEMQRNLIGKPDISDRAG